MARNTQLNWIAEADARHFREAVETQRAPSEPKICVAIAPQGGTRRHWWHRLVAIPSRRRMGVSTFLVCAAQEAENIFLFRRASPHRTDPQPQSCILPGVAGAEGHLARMRR
jgi:hypothetical protein